MINCRILEMNFQEAVYHNVAEVPKGRVATYGQIAAQVSSPRAARQVGLALRNVNSTSQVPWHRVVNARGMISIENLAVPKEEQARRLQKEGIKVGFKDGNWWVDLNKYRVPSIEY